MIREWGTPVHAIFKMVFFLGGGWPGRGLETFYLLAMYVEDGDDRKYIRSYSSDYINAEGH